MTWLKDNWLPLALGFVVGCVVTGFWRDITGMF